MTKEQLRHNFEMDQLIKKADEEYEMYLLDLAIQKAEFIKNNSDHPYKDLMFLPVLGKRHICVIKYID